MGGLVYCGEAGLNREHRASHSGRIRRKRCVNVHQQTNLARVSPGEDCT